MSNQSGVLFVVATPIGNLEDISERARRILGEVDLIAAEDTRHSRKLLRHLGIDTPMCAYHDHNERSAAAGLVEQLLLGRNIALISDAGTPLLQDPGYQLVTLAHEQGIRLVPIPGPAALITALSVAGLTTTSFVFEGFLPEKALARRKKLQQLSLDTRTMVFYEAPHRIVALISDCTEVLGGDRQACVARELSKVYETVKKGSLRELGEWLHEDANRCRGEFVVLVEGNAAAPVADEAEAMRILDLLLQALPLKKATGLAAEITGLKKNHLYKLAISLQKKQLR